MRLYAYAGSTPSFLGRSSFVSHIGVHQGLDHEQIHDQPLRAFSEDRTLTPAQYATLRRSIGPQRKVDLGIHWRTIQGIEKGEYGNPIPRKYELGLLGLLAELQGERQ